MLKLLPLRRLELRRRGQGRRLRLPVGPRLRVRVGRVL